MMTKEGDRDEITRSPPTKSGDISGGGGARLLCRLRLSLPIIIHSTPLSVIRTRPYGLSAVASIFRTTSMPSIT